MMGDFFEIVVGLFDLGSCFSFRSSSASCANVYFRRRIQQEGGVVIQSGGVGLFLRPPSLRLKGDSVFLYYRVRYGAREGTWYVSSSPSGDDACWVWCDAIGYVQLPVAREGASVKNDVWAMGSLTTVGMLLMLFVGVCGVIGYSLRIW